MYKPTKKVIIKSALIGIGLVAIVNYFAWDFTKKHSNITDKIDDKIEKISFYNDFMLEDNKDSVKLYTQLLAENYLQGYSPKSTKGYLIGTVAKKDLDTTKIDSDIPTFLAIGGKYNYDWSLKYAAERDRVNKISGQQLFSEYMRNRVICSHLENIPEFKTIYRAEITLTNASVLESNNN